VEICKLRLFLKLVAQVEEVDRIEPLPDIDFNIRAGNTLVGFANLEEVREALVDVQTGQGRFAFGEEQDALKRIEVKAADVQQLADMFRKKQLEYEGAVPSEDKERLQQELKGLANELDQFLAALYGIKGEDKNFENRFKQWKAGHQPFHWFSEFYGIMKSSGFNAIIGNPPYVEYERKDTKTKKSLKDQYQIKGYKTESCGNLYAFVLERLLKLKSLNGRCSMIVPLSGHSTDRMEPLIKHFYANASTLHLVNISADAHPSILFPGVNFRLAIFFFVKNERPTELYSTRYVKWFAEERPVLFDKLEFIKVLSKSNHIIPKISTLLHQSIINKLLNQNGNLGTNHGEHITYYHNAPVHWIRAHPFIPYFHSERDGEKISTQLKPLRFNSHNKAMAASAVLCSTLFYIWWITTSDCYHLNNREVYTFPIDLSNSEIVKKLAEIAGKLMDDFITKSKRRVYNYKTSGRVEYDEFYPKLSKGIIDEVDNVLANYYGFTHEELDFIINYDIKYRMGAETEV
ncbi:MAG: Eco57I restriction-modification methylase domain-containing protein, partial [Desulfobacteraceae bacterium]